MKKLKELKYEELSVKQKLGLVTIQTLFQSTTEEDFEYLLGLVRSHAVGVIWVNHENGAHEMAAEYIRRIREAADYPIIFIADAEVGMQGHLIGKHNAIGMTGSEELAYLFGKVTGTMARQMGINMICDPVVDMANGNCMCGGNIRSLGNDKHKVAALAVAIAKGLHDGGVLSVAKHYPGGDEAGAIDSHMAEAFSDLSEEELIDYNLYPYRALLKEGLLDGIMTRHGRYPKIDSDYPISLSKKGIGIIRRLGFDGMAITDALSMMGVVAKYGRANSIGLAVGNGNDAALAWCRDIRFAYEAMCESYDKGLIADERLDEAVRRVLMTQHKLLGLPQDTKLTEEDERNYERLNTDAVYAAADEGLTPTVSKDGKHLFVVLAESTVDVNSRAAMEIDPMNSSWYNPYAIADRIKEKFPNSSVYSINQFPSAAENGSLLDRATRHDDVVFVTFFNSAAYVGRECLTSRVVTVIDALQVTDRVAAIVHFGNPYVLEELAHIPRVIIGATAEKTTLTAIDVLAGDTPARGVLTYDIKLK